MEIDRDTLHAVAVAQKNGEEYSIHFPAFRRELMRPIIPVFAKFNNFLKKEFGGTDIAPESLIDMYDLAAGLVEGKEREVFENYVEKILFGAKAISAAGKVFDLSEVKFSTYTLDIIRGELVFFSLACRYWTDEAIAESVEAGLFTCLGVTEFAATSATK